MVSFDDIVVVDPFADHGSKQWHDPEILVRGRRDGSARRARSGQTAYASIPVPPEFAALRDLGIDEGPHRWRST